MRLGFSSVATLLLVAFFGASCGESRERPDSTPGATTTNSAASEGGTPASASAAHLATASAAPSASASATASASAASTSPACPTDMVLAEGLFCPDAEQKCLKHTREWEEAQKNRKPGEKSNVSERCLVFAESKCLSKEKRPMRFCVDRHEWPNKEGEKPAFMVTWGFAKDACGGAGKRLCKVEEFTFACEGESISPYAYGLTRDAKRCNIDKPYVQPQFRLQPYDVCVKSRTCKAHMEELDQREAIGERPECTSPFGAFDINGNVNEWVERPKETAPWRSGLMGGWWGPSRSRCRPIVTSHDENYVGYEVGFRCCKDAAPASR